MSREYQHKHFWKAQITENEEPHVDFRNGEADVP